jgi:hypothetical protein
VARSASLELGPYQLLERIGEGGSGQVYRAVGPAGPVAVKVLGPAADLDDASRARFAREIAALGQLAHPHLVPLLDHGIDAELGPYLVLPLLAGTNLRTLCAGHALCPEAAILLALPIIEAVTALHAAGFVHRDLKPENVIAAPGGSLTVIDLGLAWREGMTRHTDTGTAVGSIGYMAPEQIDGRTVDARADVWALGVMLHEWIVGKRPFQRARANEEAAAILLAQCPRLTAADRRTSDELADLVARCLALDPAQRPSAGEVGASLTAMIDWSDDIAAERAAVVAEPAGYQARIAPFRLRRIERVAREELAGGRPFAALSACDRGLAYAPEHAPLLELVATAEAATAKRAPPASDGTAPPFGAVAALAAPGMWRKRWPWFAVGAGGVAAGALAVYLLVPGAKPVDPWASTLPSAPWTPAGSPQSTMNDNDRAFAHDVLGLMGQALEVVKKQPQPPKHAEEEATPFGSPTTATGWLELAAKQEPADAVRSVRHALALNPTWLQAQLALCTTLSAADGEGALAACDIALRRRPNDGPALVARARARRATGDHDGAAADLEHACKVGEIVACQEKP